MVLVDDIDDGDQVGMPELRLDLRLIDEARTNLLDSGKVRVQDFDRNAMAKRLVLCFVNQPRAALAYESSNPVGGAQFGPRF